MKRKLGILLCLSILFSGLLPAQVSAATIMPRAEVCWNCSNGRIFYDYRDYEEISAVGGCMHGKSGIDMQYLIYHQYNASCGSCGVSTGWVTSSYSGRSECFGE